MDDFHPTTRFSSRASAYHHYRPGYPPEIITFLSSIGILKENSIVVEVGSGTGLLTTLFLKNRNLVYAIEPNDEMRAISEMFLSNFENLSCKKGTAEDLPLDNKIADIIVVGEAFHWFNYELAKKEFKRVLKDKGWIVLLWNKRRVHKELDLDLRRIFNKFCSELKEIHDMVAFFSPFFDPRGYQHVEYDLSQELNWEEFKGLCYSYTYTPSPYNIHYEQFISDIKRIFKIYAKNKIIHIDYKIDMVYGRF